MRWERDRLAGWAAVLLSIAAAAGAAPGFLAQHKMDELVPGSGLTRRARLSDYHAPLAGGPGETPVFIFEGSQPGGTALVLGGTHADETAGYLAAVVLLEQAQVRVGRLIVVPRANASGFTHTVPLEGHPPHITLRRSDGTMRSFTVGARVTNPIHQWPDPQVYVQPGSGQRLSGADTRNLNRAYPGRANGTLTEQVAYAITRLLIHERVDLAFDLHEAAPEYPVVNTIVAHERASDLAALVCMMLDERGIAIGLELSPPKLRGLSHREWGDTTETIAILLETTNPAQGRLRGRTDARHILEGRDPFYVRAAERGRLAATFDDDGWPLNVRVARHLAVVEQFLISYSELAPEHQVVVDGLPRYETLVDDGIGTVLN